MELDVAAEKYARGIKEEYTLNEPTYDFIYCSFIAGGNWGQSHKTPMNRREMKTLSTIFCDNHCNEDCRMECDCRGTICTALAQFLIDVKTKFINPRLEDDE